MVSIRSATETDAEAIASIHITARQDAMQYLPKLHSDEETFGWVRGIVLPTQNVHVGVVDDEVAGYIAVQGHTIEALYVRPRYQGRGVGSALLQLAKDRSDGSLDLWTFLRNVGARRFYESRGFVTVEFTDGTGNEEREPDVRYEWHRVTG